MGSESFTSPRKSIRRHQLREMVPLADSTIYEMEQRGIRRPLDSFPASSLEATKAREWVSSLPLGDASQS
jgi:hypothetical protein